MRTLRASMCAMKPIGQCGLLVQRAHHLALGNAQQAGGDHRRRRAHSPVWPARHLRRKTLRAEHGHDGFLASADNTDNFTCRPGVEDGIRRGSWRRRRFRPPVARRGATGRRTRETRSRRTAPGLRHPFGGHRGIMTREGAGSGRLGWWLLVPGGQRNVGRPASDAAEARILGMSIVNTHPLSGTLRA